MDILCGRTGWVFLTCFLIGCGARTIPPASPTPTLPPVPIAIPPSASFSTFNYALGAMRYQISRSAAIESRSDSSNNREISTNTTHELVTLTSAGDSGISFTAVVDTFSSTTQGLIGPVRPIQLPVQLSGIFAGNNFTISNDNNTDQCSPIRSVLLSDLHNLLTQFPAQLSQGLVWQDSVSTAGCQAAIPTASRMIRWYTVSGEAIYEGRAVLLVHRSDTIQAHGEGAQQQHRMILDAGGTGNAVYYLDTKDGRVVRLTAEQELNLTITTSSKVHQFKQSSRQDFRLTP